MNQETKSSILRAEQDKKQTRMMVAWSRAFFVSFTGRWLVLIFVVGRGEKCWDVETTQAWTCSYNGWLAGRSKTWQMQSELIDT